MGSPAISPGMGAGIAAGAGALGGMFPDNSKTIRNSVNNSFSESGFNTGTDVDIYNLLQSIIEGQSSTHGVTSGTSTSSTTPNLSPETQQLLSQLIGRYNALSAPSLTGYGAQQTSNINQGAQLQRQAVDQIMASRGLGTSPAAATSQAGIEQNRLNQITGMQQNLPILQNQMNLANLAGATSFFSTIPKGQTTTGSTTGISDQDTRTLQNTSQTGHQFGSTNVSGHATNATGSQGHEESNTTAGGGVGGAVSGGSAALMAILPLLMASDKRLKKDITDIPQDKAIEKIRELKGRAWTWKGGSSKDSGILAQEVQEVLPELVHDAKLNGVAIKAVNYAGLIPYLIGAVQNLDARIPATEEV